MNDNDRKDLENQVKQFAKKLDEYADLVEQLAENQRQRQVLALISGNLSEQARVAEIIIKRIGSTPVSISGNGILDWEVRVVLMGLLERKRDELQTKIKEL